MFQWLSDLKDKLTGGSKMSASTYQSPEQDNDDKIFPDLEVPEPDEHDPEVK